MKKMIALLLAVCLCMGTLAACGGQTPGSETTASTVENKSATETTAPVAERYLHRSMYSCSSVTA